MAFDFDKTVKKIRGTTAGRERNVYPYLRDLFVHVLGYERENIVIDTPQEGMGGNSPDMVVRLGTGIADEKGREIRHDWLVAEVKAEAGVFADEKRREAVFDEKAKYVVLGTEWFLMADPSVLVVRPVALGSQVRFDAGRMLCLSGSPLPRRRFWRGWRFLRRRIVFRRLCDGFGRGMSRVSLLWFWICRMGRRRVDGR